MAQVETWLKQDLQGLVKVSYIGGNVFSQDNAANLVGVEVYNNGEPATLSGSISGSVIRSDGVTVAVAGSFSGNRASIVLPEDAYLVPGVITIVIKNTVGSQITTLAVCVVNVYRTSTDEIADPGNIIPSVAALIAAIDEAVSSIPADYSALWESLAPAFDPGTEYKTGKYVTYDGAVYRFKNFHTGTWSSSDADIVNIGDGVYENYSKISQLQNEEANTNSKILALQRDRDAFMYMNGLQIVYSGGYMDENGEIVTNVPNHNVMVLRDRTAKQITFPAFTESVSLANVIVKFGSNIVATYSWTTTSEYTITLPDAHFDAIYINWWNANREIPFYTSITVIYDKGIAYKENIENGFNVASAPWKSYFGKTFYFSFDDIIGFESGYIGKNATESYGAVHRHIGPFPAKYIKSISLSGESASGVPYAYRYKSLTDTDGVAIIPSGVTSGSYEFEIPDRGYIAINDFLSDDRRYAQGVTIEFWPESIVAKETNYKTSARRPFSFNGKTAVYVGDSITQGYTSGSTITPNNYPKLFSEAVGLTYTNKGLGGALFTSGYNAIKTIPTQVSEISGSPDFLFIAGGVNDWQMGVPMHDLVSTLNNLCDYINSNLPNTKVIWITPIKEAGWETTHPNMGATGYLKNYCDMIFETVKKKDIGNYSVVCGYEFGFPDSDADAEYKTAAFGDLLHPSELGYMALYTVGLLNALQ